jgi:hypothetical protein
MKNIRKITAGFLTGSALLVNFVAIPAYAQDVPNTNETIDLSVKTPTNTAQALANVIAKGDQYIDARIGSLNTLMLGVQAMQNVSNIEKTNLTNEIQTNIANLTTLRAKLDADTDLSVAHTDELSIFGPFRIYALVIPRGNIMVTADKINTISNMMTGLVPQFRSIISAAKLAGKDVTSLQKATNDILTQTTDATSQALTAENSVVVLVPDQGNAAMASSTAATLVAARVNIKTAATDIQTARAEVQTVVDGIKALFGPAAMSSVNIPSIN